MPSPYTAVVPWTEFISLIALGLAAGTLGGMLGIGGSIIMIPVLTLVFRRDQHLAQAAAMIVNVFVATPAMLRHRRAQAVDWMIVWRMIPAGIVCIVLGVEISNGYDGRVLQIAFGLFLIYVIYVNMRKLLDPGTAVNGDNGYRGWMRASVVGGVTGLTAGLLGIGGGILAVPLLQRICRLPLRHCIATSAAIMCITAAVGAVRKNLTLESLPPLDGAALDPQDSLLIAACLAPTAVIGGLLGAGLTHSLPLPWIRAVLTVLLGIASAKLLGVV